MNFNSLSNHLPINGLIRLNLKKRMSEQTKIDPSTKICGRATHFYKLGRFSTRVTLTQKEVGLQIDRQIATETTNWADNKIGACKLTLYH